MGGFMYISKYTDSTMIKLLHVLPPVWVTCPNLHTFPKIQDDVQNGRHFDQILFFKITFAFNIKTGRVWYHFKGNWIFLQDDTRLMDFMMINGTFLPKNVIFNKIFQKTVFATKFWICSCYKIRLKCWFITFVKVALIWTNIVLKLWVQTCNNNNVI